MITFFEMTYRLEQKILFCGCPGLPFSKTAVGFSVICASIYKRWESLSVLRIDDRHAGDFDPAIPE